MKDSELYKMLGTLTRDKDQWEGSVPLYRRDQGDR